MNKEMTKVLLLKTLKNSCNDLTPEELFAHSKIKESDGRDALSSLIDAGKIRVGKGWKLILNYCNRHNDCSKYPNQECCHDGCCEECFGY